MALPKVSKRPKAAKETAKETKERKPRKPRKPALERAARLVETLERKCDAIVNNTARWIAPSDERLANLVLCVKDQSRALKANASTLGETMVALLETNYVATASRGGRTPLSVGEAVMLRDVNYNADAFGSNAFVVAAIRGKLYEIRSTVDQRVHNVLRAWIRRADTVKAEAETVEAETVEAETA